MYNYFLLSDLHSDKVDIQKIINDNKNRNSIFIINGDWIEKTHSFEKNEKHLDMIKNLLKNNPNLIYIKGNHEDDYTRINPNSKHIDFINNLPIGYCTKDFWISHGWINPNWTIKEHQNQKIPNLKCNYAGDILNGSISHIDVAERKGYEYFGYKNIDFYENALLTNFPNKTFFSGHTFNFMYNHPKIKGLDFFEFISIIKDFENSLTEFDFYNKQSLKPNELHNSGIRQTILSELLSNYDLEQYWHSPNKIVISLDQFHKANIYNLEPKLNIYKTTSNKGIEIKENDPRYLKEIFDSIS
ncbi:MAG: metallophosphoesterase [Mycoplasma sp.]